MSLDIFPASDSLANIASSAGMFWLHDSYHDGNGVRTWKRKWAQSTLAVLTILAGAFICVAGLYCTIKGIVEAYNSGAVASPFAC